MRDEMSKRIASVGIARESAHNLYKQVPNVNYTLTSRSIAARTLRFIETVVNQKLLQLYQNHTRLVRKNVTHLTDSAMRLKLFERARRNRRILFWCPYV